MNKEDFVRSLPPGSKVTKGTGNWVQVHGTRFHFDSLDRLDRVEDVTRVSSTLTSLRKLHATLSEAKACAKQINSSYAEIAHLMSPADVSLYGEVLDYAKSFDV